MRILTDETVSKSTISFLRSLGNDVVDVREVGLGGKPDEEVAAFAQAEERIIVTHDKDFGDLLRLQSMSHRGSVVLRLRDPSPDSTNRALSHLLSRVDEDYLIDRLIIVTERGLRARLLR